ncbi:MAG: 2-oxo acid dehydrogenase subunit E2 [Syntrophomonadaceae bacterium]|nr:2-oxo acid dehydrogenase subunit E2 [Syntrophomonadaceae bacterium]
MDNIGKYQIESFPASRIATIDIGAASRTKHHIIGLIELDVTDARKIIKAKRTQHERISFNSWLIKCISQAVDECRELHGIRKGTRKIVLFDDIDISIMIEREVQGKKVPLPYVIRKSNQKNVAEIYDEIKAGQDQAIDSEGDYVLGEQKNQLIMKIYYALPGFIRRFAWIRITQSPFLTKRNMGTVIITSVGMMGRINGWVIPVSIHPLCFAVGSIVKKPGVKNDQVEIREYLYMTILVDHDVIDGAPAVRALSHLAWLVEQSWGLT